MVQNIRNAAQIFRLLGDETRIRILLELQDGEQCVHDIADALDAELSNISHHLRKMRDQDIVTYRKDGRHNYYHLYDDHILNIIKDGIDHATE